MIYRRPISEAYTLTDSTFNIWDASSGACLQTLEGHNSWVNSVAFSGDSTRLASASYARRVKIWGASSGKCLQTLEIGKALSKISFDATGSCLYTKIGHIPINVSSTSYTTPVVTKLEGAGYQGGGLSSDGARITYSSENIVWLP